MVGIRKVYKIRSMLIFFFVQVLYDTQREMRKRLRGQINPLPASRSATFPFIAAEEDDVGIQTHTHVYTHRRTGVKREDGKVGHAYSEQKDSAAASGVGNQLKNIMDSAKTRKTRD